MRKLGFLFFSLYSMVLYSQDFEGTLNNSDESMTVVSEFRTTDFHFKQDNIYYPITTKKGKTFFIYINAAMRPVVGMINENGQVSTALLDNNNSDVYTIRDDGHNLFGMGIDKYGYIHITGDMHQHSYTYPNSSYIQRYRGSRVMYWVSRNPYDISDFEFVGHDASRSIPGDGFSYLSFTNDRNGELYARYRNKSGIMGHTPGEIAWSLSRYNADSRTWTQLGEQVDSDTYFPGHPGPFFNVVYWSPTGTGNGAWYQGFMSDVNFDFNNRMHTVAAITTDTDIENRHLMYAYSDDGGSTFYRANGTQIDLPISTYGNHWGDLTVGEGQYFAEPTITFDKEGTPIIAYENTEPRFFRGWSYYDKDAGAWASPKDAMIWFARIRPNTDANGVINFPGGGAYAATRMYGIDEDYQDGDEYHWRTSSYMGELYGHDYRSNMEENAFRTFFTSTDGSELRILRFKFEPNSYSAISSEYNVNQMGGASGSSGMLHDIFQLRSSGAGLQSGNLQGQFVRKAVSGDFTAECRVIQMDYHNDNTYAGLLVANNTNGTGNFYSNVITWDGVKTWKNTGSGGAVSYDGPYNEPSEWLRITRNGNTIRAYRSDNGKNWEQIESTTLSLNNTVYLGLVTGSGNSSAGHARIDHLTISATTPSNVPPMANAGTNQTRTDNDMNGSEQVTLNGSSSSDDDGTIVSYLWREGSTTLATTATATVNLAVGVHNITLTVTDDDGATDTDNLTVTVIEGTAPNVAPNANAGSDQVLTDADNSGAEQVTLNASSSTDSDGSIVSYSWREGSVTLATGATPSVNLSVGVHTLTLTVTDNDGATDTDNVTITINAGNSDNIAPTAYAGPDQTLNDVDLDGSESFTIIGTFSSDPDGSIVSYLWQDGTETVATVGVATISRRVGVHNIVLTVTDNDGATATDTLVVIINDGVPPNQAPEANAGADITVTDNDRNGTEIINFNGSLSSDPEGNIASYTWRSGSTIIGTGVSPSVELPIGMRTITLTVTDDGGLTDIDYMNVLVIAGTDANSVPTANAGADQVLTDTDLNGVENVSLSAAASTDSDGDIVSYTWSEGGTNLATGMNATVTLGVGTHNIELEVTDNDGGTDTDNVTITISSPSTGIANSAPVISNQSFEVNEADYTQLIGTVVADDLDEDLLTYAIVDGNSAGIFNIDQTNGNLYFSSKTVNFENNPQYMLKVRVTDDGDPNLSAQAEVTVYLVAEPDYPPQIEPQSFNASYDMNLPTLIGTVLATVEGGAQNMSFSILNNGNRKLVKIDPSSGELSLVRFPSSRLPGDYEVMVRVAESDNVLNYAQATMTISISEAEDTYYIDPDNTSTGDGSFEDPYDSWKNIPWKKGGKYLQKRGTQSVEDAITVEADSVYLGSYGYGEKSQIVSQSTDYAIKVMDKKYVEVDDLDINAEASIGCIYFLGGTSINNAVTNCKLKGGEYGVRIIDGSSYRVEYNSISSGVDGIYSFADHAEIYYNVFRNNKRAINLSSLSSTAKVFNNVFYDNRQGLNASDAEVTLFNNIFYLTDAGDQAIYHNLDKLVSDNNIYYPEQPGFIEADNETINTLEELQYLHGQDMHSYNLDPLFVDVDHADFKVQSASRAIDAGRVVGLLEDFYGTPVPSGNAPDIGLSELESPSLVQANNPNDPFHLEVYPNPSNGIYSISVAEIKNSEAILNVYTASGALVLTKTAQVNGSFTHVLDISSLQNGVYFMSVTLEEGVVTRKLIKE